MSSYYHKRRTRVLYIGKISMYNFLRYTTIFHTITWWSPFLCFSLFFFFGSWILHNQSKGKTRRKLNTQAEEWVNVGRSNQSTCPSEIRHFQPSSPQIRRSDMAKPLLDHSLIMPDPLSALMHKDISIIVSNCIWIFSGFHEVEKEEQKMETESKMRTGMFTLANSSSWDQVSREIALLCLAWFSKTKIGMCR